MDCFSMDGNLLNNVSLGYSKRFREQVNRWPANHIYIQYGIWILYEYWACNGPRILGRCRQMETLRVHGGGSATVRCVGSGQP